MTIDRIVELVFAVAILAAGVWLYRRNRSVDRGYGSQGAVLLFVVAVILAIHALGLMHYRPTPSDAEAFQARGQ